MNLSRYHSKKVEESTICWNYLERKGLNGGRMYRKGLEQRICLQVVSPSHWKDVSSNIAFIQSVITRMRVHF